MARKYYADRGRYASNVDFYDIVYDASWRHRKTFPTRIEAARDSINRANYERNNADPGVYVKSFVHKMPPKRYRRK